MLHNDRSGNEDAANDNRDLSACLILGKIAKTSVAFFRQMDSEDNPVSLHYLDGENLVVRNLRCALHKQHLI